MIPNEVAQFQWRQTRALLLNEVPTIRWLNSGLVMFYHYIVYDEDHEWMRAIMNVSIFLSHLECVNLLFCSLIDISLDLFPENKLKPIKNIFNLRLKNCF